MRVNVDIDLLNYPDFTNTKTFYNESDIINYMKNDNIDININIFKGSKKFTTYTMDLTKKYIEINSDYRS